MKKWVLTYVALNKLYKLIFYLQVLEIAKNHYVFLWFYTQNVFIAAVCACIS